MRIPTRKHQNEHLSSHPMCGSVTFPYLKNETGIYAAETETVTHHSIQFCVTFFKYDIKWFCAFIQFSHVDIWCNKVILHHQDRVDRFLYTCSTQAVACHRFSRAKWRNLTFTEGTCHGFKFSNITCWS